ncbi:PREDICTED: F-box protein At3g08750-like [Camelina sativa]|uniref:F-box protein At3g08750-like n=1 Tax=Camelina sativa TaxID=90675 RepID=A0ABM0XRA9_CAMSA|nr:PREDICTED: F-box protein At3g08750-like [Camelina sativa]
MQTSQRFLRIDDARGVQIIDPVTGFIAETPIPEEFEDLLPFSWMIHCDGLMLCICDHWTRGGSNARLAVWNPFLGRIKWIEPSVQWIEPPVHRRVDDYYGIGYGVASRDNYKILRLGYNQSSSASADTIRVFEIYEFMSGSWRGINAWFAADIVFRNSECVSVMGNMYWLAQNTEGSFVLCFDFSVEAFKFFKVTTGPAVVPRLQFAFRPGFSIGKHRNIMAWCKDTVEEDETSPHGCNWVYVATFYEVDRNGVFTRVLETSRSGSYQYSSLPICSYVYVPSLVPVPE